MYETQNDAVPTNAVSFRTPLAAAMLIGAVAGGLSLWMHWIYYTRLPNRFEYALFMVPANFVSFCGPVLVFRQWSLVGSAIKWTLVMLCVKIAASGFDVWRSFALTLGMAYLMRPAILGCIFGFATTRLYNLKPAPRLAILAGAIAGICMTGPAALFFIFSKNRNMLASSSDFLAIQALSQLIGYVLLVSLPALVVERALQMKNAER